MCIPVDISYTTKGLHHKVHVTGSHLVLSSILAGDSAQVYSIQFHVIQILSATPSILIVFSWYLLFFLQ